MKTQFTPGPWAIDSKIRTAINAPHKHVAMVNFCRRGDDKLDIYGSEHDANAALIAAAPEMFEALQDVAKAYQDLFDVMPVAWQTLDSIVTAALAKARGKK